MIPIRVCIIEDQTIVREGLVRLLDFAPDIDVVGTAASGNAIGEFISNYQPDILLLDLHMPGVDGFQTLQQLNEIETAPAVIILTTFSDVSYIKKSQRLGAKGFLLKDVGLAELVDTIKQVHGGASYFPAHNVDESTQLQESLTPREDDIMMLIADGKANKEIARTLNISEGTVKNHVTNILGKLGVRDRTQAVIRFRQLYK